MNRLAVFDCDGTLVDSQVTICEAIARGFVACALPQPTRAAARSIIGLSLVEAMRVLHPEGEPAQHDALAAAYKVAFFEMRTAGLSDEPLYEGIAQAIADLDARGWLLGVATGKSDRGLKHILEYHRLHPHFITLQTADGHPSKPHPSMLEQAMADAGARPDTTVMIGDTSYDMAMAKNAGVHAIGVTWGYHGEEELRAAGAGQIVTHASELVALIETLA